MSDRKNFLKKSPFLFGNFQNAVVWVTKGEINLSPAFAVAKGGDYLERFYKDSTSDSMCF